MQEMINHSELVCLPLTQCLGGRAFKQLKMSDLIQTKHLQCGCSHCLSHNKGHVSFCFILEL